MRFRIIERFSKETGAFLGYNLEYKPFWWWPIWREIDQDWVKDKSIVEHEICYLLSLQNIIKSTRVEYV